MGAGETAYLVKCGPVIVRSEWSPQQPPVVLALGGGDMQIPGAILPNLLAPGQ